MAKKKSSGSSMLNGGGFAGMPQEVKYHAWPERMDGFDFNLDDTITGISAQMSEDRNTLKKVSKPHKY